MLPTRIVLAVGIALLVSVGAAGAAATTHSTSPTTQELTITASDGTQLACGLVLPAGSPPAGGWPGLLLFHGLGLRHSQMEALATSTFAPAGFASLACDERGTGASGGRFDLGGTTDVQDTRDIFSWLAARPDVSDTRIGAFGYSVGGAEVWNAAAASVPFKAIVPALTWTSLSRALTPDGVVKSGLLDILTQIVPRSRWDSNLTQALDDLTRGRVTDAVRHALAERSSRGRLHSLTVPTLMIQSRLDSLFDLDQATAAYKLLAGPKCLYVGPPARALGEVVAWLQEYLAGGPPLPGGVELAHAPWDGTTTSFRNLPPSRDVVVNLLGATKIASGVLHRTVRLPGGPFETFGAGAVTVRYSGASSAWTQIAATVLAKGGSEPVSQGAAPISAPSGVVRIPLMDSAVFLPRGKRLTVRLGPTSLDGVFDGTSPPPPTERSITIERVTLALSVLQRAVSK